MVVEPAPPYSIGEQIRIPMALRREHIDLFHAPHYVLPPLDPLPVGRDDPRLHPPDVPAVPARAAWPTPTRKLQLWTAAHRSDRILTVSEASKLDILRRFRVPADKITVIYNAIDERLSLEPDRRGRASGCAPATS